MVVGISRYMFFFFFNDTATTEIYTLSLHDALPILAPGRQVPRAASLLHQQDGPYGRELRAHSPDDPGPARREARADPADRKSTRLNSSHANISYAVFCLKKKNQNNSISLTPQANKY